ncbi:MAG: hypothetical protein IPG99_13045 [Ignavibacteria bacterium]|nr:hypothetical protein [Ignavibacteria bacterium]
MTFAVIEIPIRGSSSRYFSIPKGHSKITLGVNAPFLQFSFSPLKDNIKITAKISVKSDEPRTKIDEIEIDEFAQERIDMYLMTFLEM